MGEENRTKWTVNIFLRDVRKTFFFDFHHFLLFFLLFFRNFDVFFFGELFTTEEYETCAKWSVNIFHYDVRKIDSSFFCGFLIFFPKF